MRFLIPQEPQGLERPRLGKFGVYSKQSDQQKRLRNRFIYEMQQKGYTIAPQSPIYVSLVFRHQIPESWSQKKRNTAIGTPFLGTPDVDNCIKYYLDVMNGVVYADDKLVSSVWADQIYSKVPSVEIQIHSLGESTVREHAKTVQWEIHVDDVNQLVRKANKLGAMGRVIKNVTYDEDETGKHIYFEIHAENQSSDTGVDLCCRK